MKAPRVACVVELRHFVGRVAPTVILLCGFLCFAEGFLVPPLPISRHCEAAAKSVKPFAPSNSLRSLQRSARAVFNTRCITDSGSTRPAGLKYRVTDTRTELTIVLPIGDDVKSKDVEFAATKTCLFIGVKGQRAIDGELWAAIKAEDCYWEVG